MSVSAPFVNALIGVGIVTGLAMCVFIGSALVWVRVIGQEMVRLNTNMTLLRKDVSR